MCGSVYCSLSILDSVEKLAVSEVIQFFYYKLRETHNLMMKFIVYQIPNMYKQLTHVLNVSDMLSEQNNPIDQLLELLQFLD